MNNNNQQFPQYFSPLPQPRNFVQGPSYSGMQQLHPSSRAVPLPTAAHSAVVPSKGSLFVGDISFFCTDADLVHLFEPYGRVLHVEVRRNSSGESLRHGFAELASVDAAQRAINELHSSKFMGRRIRVHWACVHVDKRQPRDRSSWTQVYVSFCALRRERVVTESLLDEIFSHFGPVADATVKKHGLAAASPVSFISNASSSFSSFSSSSSSSSSSPTASSLSSHQSCASPVWTGYAFVYFYDRQDAERAAQALRSFETEDLRLACSLSLRASLPNNSTNTITNTNINPNNPQMQAYSALQPQHKAHFAPPQMQSDLSGRPSKLRVQCASTTRSFAASFESHSAPFAMQQPLFGLQEEELFATAANEADMFAQSSSLFGFANAGNASMLW